MSLTVAKVFLGVLVGLGTLVSGAHAADWKMRATHSATLEVNSNRKLLSPPKGESYNTINSLLFDAQALTPTSKFTFDGNIDYRTFDGPGEKETLDTFNNGVRAAFAKTEKLTTYSASASRTERETSSLQLLETGEATLTGTTVISTVGAGIKHTVNPRDTVSWQINLTQTDRSSIRTDPSAGSGTADTSTFYNLTNVLDLRHQVNSVTSWVPSLQVQQLRFTGDNPTEILFWKGTTGIETKPAQNLTLKAAAGGVALSGEQRSSITTTTTSTPQSSGPSFDWVADMTLTYRHRHGTAALTAAQTTAPTTFGEVRKTQTVGMAFEYSINHALSIATNISFSHRVAPGPTSGATDVMTATASSSYRLMRDLLALLTYRYTRRISETPATAAAIPSTATPAADNIAQSHAILLVVRREVTILP